MEFQVRFYYQIIIICISAFVTWPWHTNKSNASSSLGYNSVGTFTVTQPLTQSQSIQSSADLNYYVQLSAGRANGWYVRWTGEQCQSPDPNRIQSKQIMGSILVSFIILLRIWVPISIGLSLTRSLSLSQPLFLFRNYQIWTKSRTSLNWMVIGQPVPHAIDCSALSTHYISLV